MRLLKILATVLAAIVALFIFASVLLVWLFDPNDYKPVVASWVEERTGRTLSIDDDLELSVFPWLAVETGGITLGNAPGFTTQPFLTIARASARVRLMPLLRRQVEIGTIIVEDIQVNLGRDNEARGNWEDLLSEQSEQPSAATQDEDSAAFSRLDVEGLSIRGGTVYWRENLDEVRYIVSELDLETGSIGAGSPADIELEFELLDVGAQLTYELAANASLLLDADSELQARDLSAEFRLADGQEEERVQGRIEVASARSMADGTFEIADLTLTSRLTDSPFGPAAFDVNVSLSDAEYDPMTQSLGIGGLVTEAAGIEATWQLGAQTLTDDPRIGGSVRIESGSLADALELFEIELPDGVEQRSLGSFNASADFQATADTQQLSLSNIETNFLGLTATGEASLDGAESLQARIDVPGFAPGETVLAFAAANLPETVNVEAFDRVAFTGNVDVDLETGAMSVRDIEAEMLGATASGELDIVPGANGNVVRGALKTSPVRPEVFAAAFADLLPENITANELGMVAVDTQFSYDAQADRATLNPLALEIFGLTGTGQIEVTALSTSATAIGQAQLAPFEPREFLRRFGQAVPQTSDSTALRSASLSARFEIDSESGRFENIAMSLDDSKINGNFTVNDFENPEYRFALDVDRIDVDRYLPPSADEAEDGERVAGDIKLASEPLNALRLNGRVQVGDLNLAGLSFQELSTSIAVGGGKADIESARTKLYGGEFAGGFNVDTTGALPTMRLAGQLTGVQLDPLITALMGDSNFSGTATLDLALSGRGATVTDNLHSASGTMSFALRDGVVDGFNLGGTLCSVFNQVQKLPAPDSDVPKQTQYQLIQGTATVADGIASSSDLLARNSFMDTTGRGRLALVDQQVDYDFESKMTASMGIRGCESMDRLIGGSSFPWTLGGTIAEPQILPDFGEYLRQRAEDQLRERLEESLGDRLRDLF